MEQPPPRFLRFVTALVLGAAVTAIPVAVVGCGGGDDDVPWPDDAVVVDAGTDAVDAPVPVDGPLPPPDLARVA